MHLAHQKRIPLVKWPVLKSKRHGALNIIMNKFGEGKKKKSKYAAGQKNKKKSNIFSPSIKQFVQLSSSKENQNPADRTCNLQQIAPNLCVSDDLPAHQSQLLPLVAVLLLISTCTPSLRCLFICRFNTSFF